MIKICYKASMSTMSHRVADGSALFDRCASPKLINDHQ